MDPTTKFFALFLAIISLCVLCGMSECGPCPDNYDYVIGSGTYTLESTNILWDEPPDAVPLPHSGASNMQMRVNTAERTAIVEYRKDGQTVIETWRW